MASTTPAPGTGEPGTGEPGAPEVAASVSRTTAAAASSVKPAVNTANQRSRCRSFAASS